MEVKYDRSHHSGATPEARIANRLRNSGNSKEADVTTQTGNSPQRAFHNIHHKGNVMQRGDDVRGVDIYGNPRGPANTRREI